MTLPVQDPYWTETADFITRAIGDEEPFIGPREFGPRLPKVFPYDWVHALEILSDYKGVAVHKGLMHELAFPVLRTMQQEWKCVFANAVFLFFMPPSSLFPAVSGDHLKTFHENMVPLEKLEAEKKFYFSEVTACVVLARNAHAGLETTLRSLSLLHLALVVVPAGDARQREACRSLCARYRADIEEPGDNRVPTSGEALKSGVARLLADGKNAWVASLDDSVVVRPDFLSVMEKWRDAEDRPLLGGYWEKADGVEESFHCDGFDLVVPSRPNARFLYAHRDYWSWRFGLGKEAQGGRKLFSPAQKALVIPGLVIPQAESASTGATPQPVH